MAQSRLKTIEKLETSGIEAPKVRVGQCIVAICCVVRVWAEHYTKLLCCVSDMLCFVVWLCYVKVKGQNSVSSSCDVMVVLCVIWCC